MAIQPTKVIGFDFGHGETALSQVIVMTYEKRSDAPKPVTSLKINKKDRQVTALAYRNDSGFLLGENAAIRASQNGVDEFYIAFKDRPSDDPEYQRVMSDYVRAVFEHLLDTGQIAEQDDLHFYVGCPSDWSGKVPGQVGEIEYYEEILSASGVPNLHVVRESHAALMFVLHNESVDLEHMLARGILLVDVGSSTTDFTLLKSAEHTPIDFGQDLGASLVDKTILAYTLEHHPDGPLFEQSFDAFPKYGLLCELACRKAKEEYFSNLESYENDAEVFAGQVRISTSQGERMFWPILSGQIMQEIILQDALPTLGGLSWPDAFRHEIQLVRQRLEEEGIYLDSVILTGGASHMNFIKQIVQGEFPDIRVFQDGAPETTIARGLALWGRADLLTQGFMAEIQALIDHDIPSIVDKHLPELLEQVSNTVANGIANDLLLQAMKAWRNRETWQGKTMATLNDMEKQLSVAAKEWPKRSSAKSSIASEITTWLRTVEEELSETTDAICKRYGLPPAALNFEGQIDDTPATANISVDDPTVLADTLVGVIYTIIALILIGLPGPGWIALLIGGPIALAFGDDISDAVQGWVKDRDMPKIMRQTTVSEDKINNMIRKNKSSISERIQETLIEQGVGAKLEQQIIATLQAEAEQKAGKARLMLL